MAHEKTSNFGDKVGRNIQHQKDDKKGGGYIHLPKGVKLLMIEEDTRELELDILPYEVTDPKHGDRDTQNDIAVPGTLWFRKPFKVHRNVGGGNGETVVCPRSMGKLCPICDYQKKRMNEKAEKDEIVALYAKPRSLYVVIPLNLKGYDEDPAIWDMSDKLFQETLNEELESSEKNRNFPDLKNGKTLEMKLKWKSIGEKGKPFPEIRSVTFVDRKPYDESILDEVPNLDEVLVVLSYAELEAKFFETELEDDGGKLKDVNAETTTGKRKGNVTEEADETKTSRRSRKTESEPEPEPEPDVKESRRSKRVEPEPDVKESRRSKTESELEPPRRKRGEKEEESKGKDDENPCPSGFKFGKDFEKYNDCEECKAWDACFDENKKKK